MDNFEAKVQSLLSSPDGINQILNIARSLTGAAPPSDTPASAAPQEKPTDSPVSQSDDVSEEVFSAPSPSAETQGPGIAALSPAPSGGADDILSVLSQVDPAVIQSVMGLVSEYRSTDDRRFHLLDALRPYVKNADATHIDKAMQIMRLSKVIKRAFSSNIGGGDAHV